MYQHEFSILQSGRQPEFSLGRSMLCQNRLGSILLRFQSSALHLLRVYQFKEGSGADRNCSMQAQMCTELFIFDLIILTNGMAC